MNKARYAIPNLITLIALFCGILSIKLSFDARYADACWFIVYAIFLDKLDGTLAKLLKAQSKIGNYLDSVSDAVSFGIAPSVVAYFVTMELGTANRFLTFASAAVFVLASITRLVKYSLYQSKFEDFYGIPTTLSAGLLAPYILIVAKYNLSGIWVNALPVALLLLSALMNASFRFPKVRKRDSKVFNLAQFIVIIMVYALGIMRLLPEVLFAVSALYLIIGLLVRA